MTSEIDMAYRISQEAGIATTVAIDKDKNSPNAVKWALDNLPPGIRQIVLIHVHTKLQPQGAVTEKITVDAALQKQDELQQFFLPYRGMCARKGVRAKEVVLIGPDIASALADYVNENAVSSIALGTANRNAITRAFKHLDIPSSLAKSVPDFCTVYAVSRGKVQIVKLANRPPPPGCHKPSSLANPLLNAPYSEDLTKQGVSRYTPSSEFLDGGRKGVSVERSFGPSGSLLNSKSPSPQHPVYYRNYEQSHSDHANDAMPSLPNQINHSNLQFQAADTFSYCATDFCELSGPASFISDASYQKSDASSCSFPSQAMGEIEEEMGRLRQELKQNLELFKEACKDGNTIREKKREIGEGAKRTQDSTALSMLQKEKQKSKAAAEAALVSQRIAELESQKRRCAELKFHQEVEEKKKAMDALLKNGVIPYRKYSIDDIEAATNYFALPQKIGDGGYGPVFKGFLDQTAVAIKILRPEILQGLYQLQQEVQFVSQTRHPNVIILLGVCPEYGCLVYEYMENGSLQDRLLCRNGTPPIPWRTRFKIAAEVALALHFLHQTRPSPIIHRDVNPRNVLLGKNFVSKISDGLSRLVPPAVADSITEYNITAAAGGFYYIDPQYQQTGVLTTKSDVYSLGILLLQIITARSPKGLSHYVEVAIENGVFAHILDPAVQDWPVDEALSFAKLALRCCQLRSSDRPELGSVILPELERLRDSNPMSSGLVRRKLT